MSRNERIEWTRCRREDADREVLRIADEFGMEVLDAYSLPVGHPEYKTDGYTTTPTARHCWARRLKKIKEALAASVQ